MPVLKLLLSCTVYLLCCLAHCSCYALILQPCGSCLLSLLSTAEKHLSSHHHAGTIYVCLANAALVKNFGWCPGALSIVQAWHSRVLHSSQLRVLLHSFTLHSCTLHSCTPHSCTLHSCTPHSCTLHSCTPHSCTLHSCTLHSCTRDLTSLEEQVTGGTLGICDY